MHVSAYVSDMSSSAPSVPNTESGLGDPVSNSSICGGETSSDGEIGARVCLLLLRSVIGDTLLVPSLQIIGRAVLCAGNSGLVGSIGERVG